MINSVRHKKELMTVSDTNLLKICQHMGGKSSIKYKLIQKSKA